MNGALKDIELINKVLESAEIEFEDAVFNEEGTYVIELENGVEIEFDREGSLMSIKKRTDNDRLE